MRAIESFEKAKEYKKVLDILKDYKDLNKEDKAFFVNRYVPLYLASLVEKVKMEKGEDDDSEEEEEKNYNDGDDLQNDEIIEEDEEGNSDDSEERKVGDLHDSAPENVSEMTFEEIKEGDQSSQSYVEINKDNISEISFEKIEGLNSKSYDHLSQYDFNHDEFLRVSENDEDSKSIIDSITELRKGNSSAASNFSAIDFGMVLDQNFNLVKTKADIVVQDEAMNTIIKYIGMFSDTFKESFDKLRTLKKVLISEQNKEIGDLDQFTENFMDFDNISPEFVYLILDFLEQHGLHKLSIFVCNRYRLADKLGRCLANCAFKYSHLSFENAQAFGAKILKPKGVWIQREKALVANAALHNIFEIVNPNYLKLKKSGEAITNENSLGDQAYTQLIQLGFWKKCLFIMDYKNSLALASAFCSFDSYKLIYLSGNAKYDKIKKEELSQYAQTGFAKVPYQGEPSTPEDINYSIIALEQCIWEICDSYPIFIHRASRSSKYGKAGAQLKVPEIPDYFRFNQALWDFAITKKKGIKEADFAKILIEACDLALKVLQKPQYAKAYQIYDAVSFIFTTIHMHLNGPVYGVLGNQSPEGIVKLITTFKSLISSAKNLYSSPVHKEIILRAMFAPLRIRYLSAGDSSVLAPLASGNVIIHRSSLLIEKLCNNGTIIDLEGSFVLVSLKNTFHVLGVTILECLKKIIDSKVKQLNLPTEEIDTTKMNKDAIRNQVQVFIGAYSMYSCYQSFYTLIFG